LIGKQRRKSATAALVAAANLELNKMTDEQYNAICENLQATAEPGVKVLPLEGYKECINLLGSFDDETLEMASKLHKDLHPGQAFLKVMQLPIRDKLCTFCGSFFRASRGNPSRAAIIELYVYDSQYENPDDPSVKRVSAFIAKEVMDFRSRHHGFAKAHGGPVKINPNN
jgi:hypothetical protein